MKRKILLLSIIVCANTLLFGCLENKKKVEDNKVISEVLGISSDEWEEKLKRIDFTEKYPEYKYVLSDDDIFNGISIANYDINIPQKADKLQEVVEYGNLYGTDKDSDKYIQISLIEKEKNYSIDINYETGERINENGNFFIDRDKEEYINEKVNMIREVIN
ncbi:hypothetical protein SAMN04487886_105416 [Clostridium sp. DSM 8431]|uniref:hypothetical protein n=1 Tax=Clostridium sp. DSM 8431 TaxID=1761781 RepID=UPI0008E4A227|nr:hypothetical protein [Clostridium sp. DSM 8431]SFU55057.1 hypothetical protein SAMN04487886_105416 [Clostridium sp. DSM 8431]